VPSFARASAVQRHEFVVDESAQAGFVPGEFRREHLEDLARLPRRTRIRFLDRLLERGDPVVEPDREVERVLWAAIPDLVDRLLDRGEVPVERVAQ
jgi:hypothetical protein